jgi:putative cardiolipin synthase
MVAGLGPHPADQSGFLLVPKSIDALAIRLLLAEGAQRSLDVQYYMINDDIIGRVFIASLVQAADRGVKVRLLIDDISTGGMDEELMGIADHPNIDLRLFNPFASRGMRALDFWQFQRLNRRMHNKSFTADNQATIIGGRNIAAEYFAYHEGYNFGDLDTLAVGPIVDETSDMFDRYWNHRKAVPMKQVTGQQDDNGERMAYVREQLTKNVVEIRNSPYADAVKTSLDKYVGKENGSFIWAPYQLVFDSPDKVIASKSKDADNITTPMLQTVLKAQESLLVISPYFVPRSSGVKNMAKLQDTGVQIDIITNSLASSDHILVHSGYAPSRKPLLKHGVRFFEVKEDIEVDGTEAAGTKKAKSSLHTKAFVVDKRYFFMGSFNWDPRSAHLNTELGVIIDSEEMATAVENAFRDAIPHYSYEVYLNAQNKLRWRTFDENGVEKIFDKEPNTSFWKRLQANLGRLLPIRSQL